MSLLARDPALPQRDVLLDEGAAGVLLARLLGRPLDACTLTRATYRVGKSLRVLYRVRADGRTRLVAARTFAPGRVEQVYRDLVETATPTPPLAAVAWEPRLRTVFWTLPNERRLALWSCPGAVLVAYAPERTATMRFGDSAFVKLYADDAGERAFRLHAALPHTAPVARAAGYDPATRRLVLEPVPGRPLAMLRPDRLAGDYAALGAALAALHESPAAAPRFARLGPDRLRAAAASLALVRPEAAGIVGALAERLVRRRENPGQEVLLHGDPHGGNALVEDGAATLIDLDQAARGDAAADLGGVLAGLRTAARLGALPSHAEQSATRALLDGYGRVRSLPTAAALRWHVAAALLVERSLRAVTRARPEQLRRLPLLLADAEAVLR
jgi:aminoglycoside phosphotransferase